MIPDRSIHTQVYGFRSRTLDPLQIVEEHLSRIAEKNPQLNALLHLDADRVRKAGKQRRDEAAQNEFRGRLHGVLCTVRESIDVAGLPRSDGSAGSLTDSAPHSAGLVERVLNEGAIVIGKGNIAEYGKSYFTENPLYGVTNHFLDPRFSPGGSGGGDAVALASGFASFAIGADAGGSVRVPANFCGIYGMIPTPGIFTQHGLTHAAQSTSRLFRNLGVSTRTLEDLQYIYPILAAFDARDAGSVSPPVEAFEGVRQKRCLVIPSLNGIHPAPEISAALDEWADRAKARGYAVTRESPRVFEETYEPFIILAGQATLALEDLSAQLAGAPRQLDAEGRLMKGLRHRIAAELPPLSPQAIMLMWKKIDLLRAAAAELFAHYDFILSPVAATLPVLHATSKYQVGQQELQSQQVFHFATAVNALGLPAVAFPTGTSSAGFPVGLQIIGPRFSDERLLRALRLLQH